MQKISKENYSNSNNNQGNNFNLNNLESNFLNFNFDKGNSLKNPFNTFLDKIDVDNLKSSKEKINNFSNFGIRIINNKNNYLYNSTEDNRINLTPKRKNIKKNTHKTINSVNMYIYHFFIFYFLGKKC